MAIQDSDILASEAKEAVEQRHTHDNKSTLDKISEYIPISSTNRNILDNWDFRNPVNQRGLGEYTGSAGYCIDRYYRDAKFTVTLEPKGLNIESNAEHAPGTSCIHQVLENKEMYTGNKYTLSVLCSQVNGDFRARIRIIDIVSKAYVDQVITSDIKLGLNIIIGEVPQGSCIESFQINSFSGIAGSSVIIQAVKLELGEVSTLANDAPMDYGAELAKCQRYQVVYKNILYSHVANRFVWSWSGSLTFNVPLPVPLRTNPQVSVAQPYLAVNKLPNIEETGFTFTLHAVNNLLVVIASKANHGLSDASLQFKDGLILDANIY